MLGREYDTQLCSIARALEVVGERWTLLVVRSVFLGDHRFDALQESLGITRSVLTTRLNRLVDEGVLERRPYSQRPPRDEYHLTEKGRALWPLLHHLMQWGDRHYPEPEGPPRIVEHRGCGGHPDDHLICDRCGARLESRDLRSIPGPAMTARGLTGPRIPASA
ncbi:winged helix-turn-helix transcriptional regulator [Patulibacter defluvii]|uniref:winged helix-turn-helix transcriptional regulator n=1 Tax=Patulibacter defluvii TaxID=3095358 RepID=UPI002A755034|nr:helix-turn-helix domain-containing protein [Patulibacter sp. DM4]